MQGNRKGIMFSAIVREFFDYLINEYEFECEYSDINSVIYRKNDIYISFFYERVSYEVYVIFEMRMTSDLLRVKLNQIALLESTNSIIGKNYYAKNKELLINYLNEAKKIFNKYCSDLVLGHEKAYKFYSSKIKGKNDEMLFKIESEKLHKEMTKLWNEKKYRELVNLCKGKEDMMTKSQLFKYNYAKKNLINDL